MSKVRRQRMREEKRKGTIIRFFLILMAAGVLVVIGIYFYEKFLAKKPPESFIPENPTSFISINLRQSPDQDETIKKLGKRFGDEDLLENTLKGIIFPGVVEEELELPEEKKIKAWLGQKIGLSHFKVSSVSSASGFILELKNKELAREFLHAFEENLKKKGNVVEEEDFRGQKITKILGGNEISYAVSFDYLLISQKSDGVKKMIDTRSGRFGSLSSQRDYFITKKKVKSSKALAFTYLDTLEFLKTIYGLSTKSADKDILSKIESIKRKEYLGLSVIPRENGFLISGFTKKKRGKTFEKIKPRLDKIVPSDVLLSLEGKNLKPFLEEIIFGQANLKEAGKKELLKRGIELETGLNLDEDFLSLFEKEYILTMYPAVAQKPQIGMVFMIKDKSKIEGKMEKVEKAVSSLLNKYVFKEGEKASFTEHDLGETKYRYLNLPERFESDITYAIFGDYLIFASDEEVLKKLTNGISQKLENSLSQNASYKDALLLLDEKKPHQIIFSDIQGLIKFVNKYVPFDYEKMDEKIKRFATLEIIHEEKSDGSHFHSFLEIE